MTWALVVLAAAGAIGAVAYRVGAPPGDVFKRLLSRTEIKPDARGPAQSRSQLKSQSRSAATPNAPAERDVTFPGNLREQGERPQLRATLYNPLETVGPHESVATCRYRSSDCAEFLGWIFCPELVFT